MEAETHTEDMTFHQDQIISLIKKTYEHGNMEQMTISKLMEQLKIDLQGAIAK
ncbi:hypothetical protein [Mesobacillus boroniphilus]|uniref:hypothetical protein n=1 Tax=Mesobacillus boroniphilus TaxID=308892 RepID=UPI001BD00A80|nr:hypothetical protein [Mesobacillus boroniphilus]